MRLQDRKEGAKIMISAFDFSNAKSMYLIPMGKLLDSAYEGRPFQKYFADEAGQYPPLPVVRYVIGVDSLDKNACAYCLTREVDGKIDVLLTKRMRNEAAFNEEVENLSKYFNAAIIKEVS